MSASGTQPPTACRWAPVHVAVLIWLIKSLPDRNSSTTANWIICLQMYSAHFVSLRNLQNEQRGDLARVSMRVNWVRVSVRIRVRHGVGWRTCFESEFCKLHMRHFEIAQRILQIAQIDKSRAQPRQHIGRISVIYIGPVAGTIFRGCHCVIKPNWLLCVVRLAGIALGTMFAGIAGANYSFCRGVPTPQKLKQFAADTIYRFWLQNDQNLKKNWKFRANHLVLDQYVPRWKLSNSFGVKPPIAHA